MSSKFFTNEGENTLLNKFAGVFAANKDIERFDALVGYLRSSGYFSIRPHLENVPRIRILVGINVDEIVESCHRKGHLFLTDAGAALDKFRKDLAKDIEESSYSTEVEKGIAQFVEDVVSKKLEIRAHPTRNLHAKIYVFLPENFGEQKPGAVITGSSNLTDAGLGTKDKASNYEFNVLLHDHNDVKFARSISWNTTVTGTCQEPPESAECAPPPPRKPKSEPATPANATDASCHRNNYEYGN